MSGTIQRSGLPAIVLATVVAGLAGYVAMWFVFRGVGAAEYAVFAVFWSAIYLIVGGLSGIQQEVTRGTRVRGPDEAPGRPVARDFALLGAGVIVVVVLLATPLWVGQVFPGGASWLVLPLAVGAGSYVVVAVVAGTLAGMARWAAVAWMIAIDGLLRVVSVGFVLLIDPHPVALGWAVALPFPVAVIIVWLRVRRGVVGHSRLDVTMRPLIWNTARTSLAAVSMAVLVSGFPLVLKFTTADIDAGRLGVVILALTLVRAPLIVSAMSLQSYLVVAFRPPRPVLRSVLVVAGLLAAAGVLLGVLGAWLGPWLFRVIFGAEAVVDGLFIAVLVTSSAVVGAMFATGSALLSRADHAAYTLGWSAAAVATIVALLVPHELEARVATALIVGPAVGILVHAAALVARHRKEPPRA